MTEHSPVISDEEQDNCVPTEEQLDAYLATPDDEVAAKIRRENPEASREIGKHILWGNNIAQAQRDASDDYWEDSNAFWKDAVHKTAKHCEKLQHNVDARIAEAVREERERIGIFLEESKEMFYAVYRDSGGEQTYTIARHAIDKIIKSLKRGQALTKEG